MAGSTPLGPLEHLARPTGAYRVPQRQLNQFDAVSGGAGPQVARAKDGLVCIERA